MRPTFSLLHATDRVPGWEIAAQAWFHRCQVPELCEHILVTKEPLSLGVSAPFALTTIANVPNSRGGTDQWNKAASIASGFVLIKIADDLFPPKNWDVLLVDAIPNADVPVVVDVAYRSNPGWPILDCGTLIPHAIISREYYKRFGYLEHPDYSHNMADVEFSDVAHASGCVVRRRDIVFIHQNPEDGTATWDDVYRRQRTPEKLREARAIYEKRKSLGFPKESVLPLMEVECSA